VQRGRRLTLVPLPRAIERTVEALRGLAGLISLRGFDAAREVLRSCVESLSEGLVAETFDGAGRPLHRAPEPSLWLVIATELYARRSGDLDFVKGAFHDALEEAVHFYRSGTRDGLQVGKDGLLGRSTERGRVAPAELNVL